MKAPRRESSQKSLFVRRRRFHRNDGFWAWERNQGRPRAPFRPIRRAISTPSRRSVRANRFNLCRSSTAASRLGAWPRPGSRIVGSGMILKPTRSKGVIALQPARTAGLPTWNTPEAKRLARDLLRPPLEVLGKPPPGQAEERSRLFLITPNNMAEANLMWDDIQSVQAFLQLTRDRGSLFGGTPNSMGQFRPRPAAIEIPDRTGRCGRERQYFCLPCWLAYIQARALSDSEVENCLADRRRRDTRRLYAADDVFTAASFLRFKTADDVRRQIEPYGIRYDFSECIGRRGRGHDQFTRAKWGN